MCFMWTLNLTAGLDLFVPILACCANPGGV
jgi:hypothetical protein